MPQALEVAYLLKIPNHAFVRDRLGTWRPSTGADGILLAGRGNVDKLGAAVGRPARVARGAAAAGGGRGTLALDTYNVTETADVPTNIAGIHALTAWRVFNAVVEQRIEELGQLAVGQTAVDEVGGNRLLWALGGLAYQLLHLLRSQRGRAARARPARDTAGRPSALRPTLNVSLPGGVSPGPKSLARSPSPGRRERPDRRPGGRLTPSAPPIEPP